VTAPKDLDPAEHERFFKASYQFLEDRYGRDNVISAYVHNDESGQPHMHYAWVPVAYDTKKERLTVSAKLVTDKKEMKRFHPELERHLKKELGHDVHVITGELSSRPNLTMEQYQDYQETLKCLQEAQKSLQDVEKALEDAEGRLAALNAEIEPKKAYIEEFARLQAVVDENVRFRTTLTGKELAEMPQENWELHKMTYMDKQAAQKLYERAIEMIQGFQSTVVGERHAELLQELDELREITSQLREYNAHMAAQIDKVNEVFERNPAVQAAFSETYRVLEADNLEHQSRDW
jgi:hypothetical protein